MSNELHARVEALKARVSAFHGTHNQDSHGNRDGGSGSGDLSKLSDAELRDERKKAQQEIQRVSKLYDNSHPTFMKARKRQLELKREAARRQEGSDNGSSGGGGFIGGDPDYSKSNWAKSLHKGYDKVRERYPDPTHMGLTELNYKLQERGNDPDYRKMLWEHWDHATAHPKKSNEESDQHYKKLRRKLHMFWNKNMNSVQ